ncbi:hypothetical protein RW03080701_098 [Synechococcus phage S-RIM8]|uniref:DUF6321 domain-containing protein n=1 Tax=Synechococcus phage S-RIM8 TaxID=756278 RepID=A0A1D7SA02_9CAUD|nr:hypothetical protein RW03080701_098 [Synechococcus phage S-RIM8]
MAGGFKSDIPPAVNNTAKRYIRGMQKGRIRWNRLYGIRAKEVMHKTANKMAMGEMQKMPPTYNEIFGEANKSGDSSLRDWFSKSRASDGTPGWVQLGGQYAGLPCAKQPGQTTKPKCGSSKMAAALNSDEEEKAFRRKNAEDPNPDRRGKAKNVATEETIREAGDYWHPDPDKDRQISGQGNKARAREDRASRSSSSSSKPDPKKLRPGESYMQFAQRQKAGRSSSAPAPAPKERKRDRIGRAIGRVVDRVAGIKSEARNPYAIGMAQAMKSTGDTPPLKKSTINKAHKIADAIKKEEKDHEVSMAQSQLSSVEKDVKALKKKLGKKEKNLPAWMQAKITDTEHNMDAAAGYLTKEAAGEKDACYKKVKSRYKVWPSAYASGALVKCRKVGAANWGNKSEGLTFQEFQEKALKCWKGCRRVPGTTPGAKGSCTCEGMEETNEGAAWTRREGQNSEGGLNEKGRRSYEAENPGSDLKRPSKKVGNERRASFCARMQGMKKRLTSAKTANDPDSRINKSLRAWNC